MDRKTILSLLAAVLSILPSAAKVTLCQIFSDGMVLQRESSARIWGFTDGASKVSLSTSWDSKLYTCKPAPNGSWVLTVNTPKAGGPYFITIDDGDKTVINDVLIGEVWICSGQSNMEMKIKGFPGQPVDNAADYILEADNYDIHAFTLARAAAPGALNSCIGKWERSSIASVPEISATAYLFARRLQATLKLPVGIIVSAWGGTSILGWMPENVIDSSISQSEKGEVLKACGTAKDQPAVLYNGMIAPLAGYSARGFIWYQGEANVTTPQTYGKLLAAMIPAWRQAWGDKKGEMPFYAVEIAPYRYGRGNDMKYDRPLTVEATAKALASLPNTGIATTGDAGNAVVIHPAAKQKVGDRLAFLALKNCYGYGSFDCNPPEIKKLEFSKGVARIWTKGADVANDAVLYGFELAGKDECYYLAKAFVERREAYIEISSPDVPAPVALRYGFHNYCRQNWASWLGIPALPFRTDKWDYKEEH